MISGFVETVAQDAIEGWAFDRDAPDAHLRIEVLCDGRMITSGVAAGFRADLATSRLGNGDHAFRFKFDQVLALDDLPAVLVRARHGSGPAVELRRWTPKRGAPPTPHPLAFPAEVRDTSSRPVFVLGAARSGTSAVAQGLIRSTPYLGNQEGHLIILIEALDAAIKRHYIQRSDDYLEPLRNTMIKMAGPDYFYRGVALIFINAMRQLFPKGLWLDKTPGHWLIVLAPRLLEIWPNARFIFMRRRALENIASRQRKFPEDPMEKSCEQWAKGMEAWETVRVKLGGYALELDQLCVARTPEVAAAEISALLNFDEAVQHSLGAKLAEHRPEQTADDTAATLAADELGWSGEDWRTFERYCGDLMSRFNYSRDRSYFADERPDNWFARI